MEIREIAVPNRWRCIIEWRNMRESFGLVERSVHPLDTYRACRGSLYAELKNLQRLRSIHDSESSPNIASFARSGGVGGVPKRSAPSVSLGEEGRVTLPLAPP